MLLVTARPSFNYGFGGHPIVSRLSLNRLGRDQVHGIVNRITKDKSLPSILVSKIVEKTDGVPLFVEELTKTLLDSNQLQETEAGYIYDGELDQLSIPNSLNDSLMARLDRMQAVKEVAQTAACLGREFEYQLLEAVSLLNKPNLIAALDQLVEAEIVYKRGKSQESSFTFKHALVRDAAYESLLKVTRVDIHKRILSQLEIRGTSAPEVLAHHASKAELLTQAIDYWIQAGDQAVARPAFDEAISHYKRVTQCIESLNSNAELKSLKLDVLVKLSNASTARFGYSHPETVKAKIAARKMLDTMGETKHRVPLLYGSWVTNHVIGDHTSALTDAKSLSSDAERSGNRVHGLIGYRLLGSSLEMMGELEAAEHNFAKAYALNIPEQDMQLADKFGSDPGVSIRVCWAISLLCRGEALQAFDLISNVEKNSRELENINAYAYTLFHLSWLFAFGNLPDRKRLIKLSRDLSAKYDLKMWYAYTFVFEGSLLHDLGKHKEAVEQFAIGFKLCRDSQVALMTPYHHALHACSLTAINLTEEAKLTEQLVLTKIDEGTEQIATPEIYRMLADTHYWASGNSIKAIEGHQQAIELANQQGAALWTLRATMSLAKIYSDTGKLDKAISKLTTAVNQFPIGGNELPDYKSAIELLEKLNTVSNIG